MDPAVYRGSPTGIERRFDALPHPPFIDDNASAGSTDTADESVTHFSGQWKEMARLEVTDAIQAAEQLIAHRTEFPVPSYGSRWVCVVDTVVDRTYFLAHRLGATSVLRGTSVDELKEAICAFALDH